MLVCLYHLTMAMLLSIYNLTCCSHRIKLSDTIKTEINIFEKSLNTVFVALVSFVCSFFLSLGLISIIPGSKIEKQCAQVQTDDVTNTHVHELLLSIKATLNTVPVWNLF